MIKTLVILALTLMIFGCGNSQLTLKLLTNIKQHLAICTQVSTSKPLAIL